MRSVRSRVRTNTTYRGVDSNGSSTPAPRYSIPHVSTHAPLSLLLMLILCSFLSGYMDFNERVTISEDSAKVEAWKKLCIALGEREEKFFKRREKDLNNLLVYVRHRVKFNSQTFMNNHVELDPLLGKLSLGRAVLSRGRILPHILVPIPARKPAGGHKRLPVAHLTAVRFSIHHCSVSQLDYACLGG